jgi:hypothetical protein
MTTMAETKAGDQNEVRRKNQFGRCDRASLRRQSSGLLRAQTRAGIERVLKRMNSTVK